MCECLCDMFPYPDPYNLDHKSHLTLLSIVITIQTGFNVSNYVDHFFNSYLNIMVESYNKESALLS